MQPFQRYLFLTIVCFFILGWAISFYLPNEYPKLSPINFSPEIRKTVQLEIDEYKPEVLLLGNSVLEEGIDQALFEQITAKQTMKVSEGGSTSAYWYLMVKNNIITANNPPPYVLLFFLDNLLTRPDFAVMGDYIPIIDEIAGDQEQVLLQKAYPNQINSIEGYLDSHFSIFGERDTVKNNINNPVKYALPESILNCDESCLDQALDFAFNASNMLMDNNQDDPIDASKSSEEWDFSGQIDNSFLPDIIQLTRGSGITLVLVREKSSYVDSIADEIRESKKYYADLYTYLLSQGVPLLNFAYEPTITKDMFYDSMHFNANGREVFTRLVAEGFLEITKQK